MGIKKKITTNQDWFKNFTHKFFKNDNLFLFSEQISENYKHLSSGHIYYLVLEIGRLIFYEFKSCRDNNFLLHSIEILHKIMEGGVILNEEIYDSNHIKRLSDLNAGDLESIEWYLSEAIGPRHYKLDMVNNVEDYQGVVKEIVKDITLHYLRNFYNFLVTKPSLSEIEQKMVNTIQSTFTPSENVPPFPEQIAYQNMSPR